MIKRITIQPGDHTNMKFSIVFSSHESMDLSFGLTFTPNPAWIQGKKVIVNLNSETPAYQLGSFRKLLNAESITSKDLADARSVCLLVHQTGRGTQNDLNVLSRDIEMEGFGVHMINLD
jgi:hypothetical protein